MNIKAFRLALAGATMLAGGGAWTAPAHAQESQASLRGTITAPAGNPVREVSAVEVQTGYRRTATLDAGGAYNFPALRPGTYRLEIVLTNGTRNSDEFQLSVSQTAGLDIDLTQPQPLRQDDGAAPDANGQAPADTSGDVVVTANRLQSLEGGEVGTNISQRLIDQLPQNSRNFLAFADLAPGVRFVEEGTTGQARLQGGAQDSRTVNVFIDGVSQKDFVLKNGITGQDSTPGNPFPQLAIGEYRVISSNYKAEFDQVASVAITAITKSGTNRFSGDGFFDYTDQSLRDARPSELRTGKIKTKDMQFGGALSGPIIPDIMHFFVSYEGKRRRFPVDIVPGGGTQVSALPTEFQDLFGNTSSTFNEDLYFAKLNISPTDRDLFEFTGKIRNEDGLTAGGGTATEQTGINTKVDEKRFTGRWQHTGDAFVNDLLLSYQDVSWAPTPRNFENGSLYQATLRNGNSVQRFNLFSVGGGPNFQDKGQKGFTLRNDFTYSDFEGHTIKAGVKSSWVTLNSLQQNFFNAQYTYDVNLFSQTGFNTTVPYRVQFGAQSGPGNSVVKSKNWQLGLYIQDDWDVTDRLTLNLGLRWDYERTPAYLDFVTPQVNIDAVTAPRYPNLTNADYDINDYISTGNNRKAFTGAWQPRIGFSYEFDDLGSLVAFGGYGRSYDRNQFDFLQQEISVGAFQTRTFNFIGNDSQNPCTPSATCIPFLPIYLTPEGRQILANSSPGGGRELRFINNDLKVPYSDQFSLGLRKRFPMVELEVGYTHIESKDGFAFLLGNRRPDGSFFFDNPAITTDGPAAPFTFTPPGFGSIIIGDQGQETRSDAGYFKLIKRYTAASPWSLDATYTYTEAEENRFFGETFSLDFPSVDAYPFLRSAGVPRHRFVTAGSVDTPIGLTLSAKFQIESPRFVVGFVNSTVPFERTVRGVVAEGSGDRWGRRQLDLAVTKYISLPFLSDRARVRLRVDIINAMNDRNYVDFNNNAADNTRTSQFDTVFGERSGIGIGGNPPRTIKLSTGFSF